MKAENLEKAMLWCPEHDDWSFTFPFNPKTGSMRLQRRVSWDADGTDGAWGGALQYSKGDPDELDFDILLDETLAAPPDVADATAFESFLLKAAFAFFGPDPTSSSVLKQIHALYRLSLPILPPDYHDDEYAQRPPLVAFVWGDFEFLGTIEELSFDFQVFTPEGIPKRALASVSLKGRAMSSYITSAMGFWEQKYVPKKVKGGKKFDRDTDRLAVLGSSGELE